MIGTLAYGSLIANPGEELMAITQHIIQNVETPFDVEYARSSGTRAGAPTIVPVSDGKGGHVQAVIFVLREDISLQAAKDMLYRREINKVGKGKSYTEPKLSDGNMVVIRVIQNFQKFSALLYTDFILSEDTRIAEIYDDKASPEQKGEKLANLAVDSVTPETFQDKRDGILYLHDNISAGILTPLTKLYQAAILRKAIEAQNLLEARDIIARTKGII